VIQNDQREGLYMDGKKLNGLSWKMINGTKYVWTVITFFDPSIVTVYHTSSAVRFGLYVFGWSLDTFIGSYAYAGGCALKGKICKSVSEKIKKKPGTSGKRFVLMHDEKYNNTRKRAIM
jgi:hypothetical protein